MLAGAKNPDRVLDKVREARFFLVQMAIYEQALDTEKFLYCLSAFMSAFRTVAFRLYGVSENLKGTGAKRALKDQLHGHPEIRFLIERTNVELHEDGAVVFQRYTVRVTDPEPARWRRDAPHDSNRFRSHFRSRYSEAAMVRQAAGWQFAGSSKNLIELCHDAIEAMEGFIRQVLATGPNLQNPVCAP